MRLHNVPLVNQIAKSRAQQLIPRFKHHLKLNQPILDLGAGCCHITHQLQQTGYQITPLDVQNLSFIPEIKPQIYDGHRIPYPDNHFHTCLILTVLHHTTNQQEIITEARRVSQQLIIIEDIYTNPFHKYLTYAFDSLVNFEFKGHPHSNRNDQQWRQLFKKLNLNLIEATYNTSFLIFRHATYCLTKAT